MNHSDLILFFLQLAVMLTFALVFGQLMHKLHQPVVLGELIGGVVLGPTVLGLLFPNTYDWLFPDSPALVLARSSVIWLGMAFFMFVAGLEVDLNHLRQRGLSTVLISLFGVAVPFGLGFMAVLLWPGLWGIEAKTELLTFGLFIGAALSISALPVIARTLADLGLLIKELGTIIMVAATVNDLIGWSFFAVILSNLNAVDQPGQGLWNTLGFTLLMFVVIIGAGRWLGGRALPWVRAKLTWPGGFIGVTAVVVLAAAAATEAVGVHAFFGAFLIGVGLRLSVEKPHDVYKPIEQFAVSFLAPIYFVSIGLQANFALNFDWRLVLLVIVVASVGKVGGASLAARWSGMSLTQALVIGFGLNARGAMEIILASIALEYGLIDQRVFVALVTMALVTSILSGPVIKRLMMKTGPPGVETGSS